VTSAKYVKAIGDTYRAAALAGVGVRQAYSWTRGTEMPDVTKKLFDVYLGRITLAELEDQVEAKAYEYATTLRTDGNPSVKKKKVSAPDD